MTYGAKDVIGGCRSPAMGDFTVSAGMARSYFSFAVERGADASVLAARAGIDLEVFDDLDNRVPLDTYMALLRAGKALTGDDALPLRFAEAIDMSEFSVVGLLTLASETMLEAHTQLNRYGQLVAEVDIGKEGRFKPEFRSDAVWVVDTRKDPNETFELTESTFTRMIAGPRRFLPFQHVLEVHVTHAEPAHRAAYDEIWRCPVSFNTPWNAMRMDPAVGDYRVRQHPRYAFSVLSEHAERLLKELEASKTVRGRVESLLMPILHTGDVAMTTIAAKMDQSRHTLHRALKDEGVTFEEVLDDLRHKLALHYLQGRRVSVNETAYLVGFSDPAAFSRAFKRWTGFSPRDARKAS
jgi:AraC-like DNA-binding protein